MTSTPNSGPFVASTDRRGHDPVKQEGKHYTPGALAEFVASQIIGQLPVAWRDRPLRVLDPALGDGSLLEAIGIQLQRAGFRSFELHGLETDLDALGRAHDRLTRWFPSNRVILDHADFLQKAIDTGETGAPGNLFAQGPVDLYDVVIANPPYVRTQVLGAERAQEIARQFGLKGRVDLYQAFIQGISRVLGAGGHVGLIVSNRFLTTKSGSTVRETLLDKFEILHIWDLGDTKLFEAAVLPALLFLRRKATYPSQPPRRFSSIYSFGGVDAEAVLCPNVIGALTEQGVVALPDGSKFLVQHGEIDFGKSHEDVWRLASAASDSWLKTVERHTACTFADVGKVRVGVKTTADRVFIRSDWDQFPESERPELLRPLLTHLDARRFRAKEGPTRKQILYPYDLTERTRTVVDLATFPKTKRYLEKHRSALESRDYVLKAGRAWHEIWVPQDPSAWTLPKLVFRDISEAPVFWLDLSGAVVNGDCYWFNAEHTDTELLWLALGVANSKFIEAYYDKRFNNKLYSGRRRFMTQYVEMFPLPENGTAFAGNVVHLSRELYARYPAPGSDELEEQLNQAVWQAFGLPIEEVPR